MSRPIRRSRWIAAAVVAVAVAGVCVRLGFWQLDRLDERRTFQATIQERGSLEPAPVDAVLPPAADGAGSAEYRRVVATGTYDRERELLVLAKSLQGTPGQHVVTPLRLDDGTAVLVERGFVPVADPAAAVPPDARAPAGEIRVEGVLRDAQSGGRLLAGEQGTGTLGHVTRIDVEVIGAHLPYPLRSGYLRIEAELEDAAGRFPTPPPPPEPGEGPHLGYALQWFTFGVIALAGWVVLYTRRTRPVAAADLEG